MTRNGKIARLPLAIRDELNRRLANSEFAEPILAWLNELPEVQQVLAKEFEGVRLSKQNLSQWRKGGFHEWQVRQQALELVPNVIAGMEQLQPKDGETVADRLAPWLAVQYYMIAETMLNQDDVDKIKVLRLLSGDVSALRRGDHRLAMLRLNEARLKFEQRQSRRPSSAGGVGHSQS